MANINQNALTSLQTALSARLPTSDPPQITYTLAVIPMRISQIGIGQVVQLNADPIGDVGGCRVVADAVVEVRVQAGASITQAVSQLTSAVLTQDRASLRSSGLLRLDVKSVVPGPNADQNSNVTLDVLYEYLEFPIEAGDVIATIPLNVTTG